MNTFATNGEYTASSCKASKLKCVGAFIIESKTTTDSLRNKAETTTGMRERRINITEKATTQNDQNDKTKANDEKMKQVQNWAYRKLASECPIRTTIFSKKLKEHAEIQKAQGRHAQRIPTELIQRNQA